MRTCLAVGRLYRPSRLLRKPLDTSATSHAAFGDGSRPSLLNLGGHPPGPLYPRSYKLFNTLLVSPCWVRVFGWSLRL